MTFCSWTSKWMTRTHTHTHSHTNVTAMHWDGESTIGFCVILKRLTVGGFVLNCKCDFSDTYTYVSMCMCSSDVCVFKCKKFDIHCLWNGATKRLVICFSKCTSHPLHSSFYYFPHFELVLNYLTDIIVINFVANDLSNWYFIYLLLASFTLHLALLVR